MSLSSTSVSGWFCSSPLVTQNQNLNINMHPPTSLGSSSSNPFFLKFIQGNIRVCQGCRGSIRKVDGSIPQALFDLAVARFERRPYRDKTGELRTPTRDQAAHYHLQRSCIQTVSPSFVLTVPSDVLPLLTATHKEYLRLIFNLQFIIISWVPPHIIIIVSMFNSILLQCSSFIDCVTSCLSAAFPICSFHLCKQCFLRMRNSVQNSVHSPVQSPFQSPESRVYTYPSRHGHVMQFFNYILVIFTCISPLTFIA